MPSIAPEAVLQQLQPIFQDALNDSALVITRNSSAMNTPNWDSLAYIEIIQLVESQFKVRFALGELGDMQNVGDLVDLIVEKSTAK